MAGRMYEALNTQLLTDLPLFVGCGVKVVQHSLTAFIHSHRQHMAMAREAIKPLMQVQCTSCIDFLLLELQLREVTQCSHIGNYSKETNAISEIYDLRFNAKTDVVFLTELTAWKS